MYVLSSPLYLPPSCRFTNYSRLSFPCLYKIIDILHLFLPMIPFCPLYNSLRLNKKKTLEQMKAFHYIQIDLQTNFILQPA